MLSRTRIRAKSSALLLVGVVIPKEAGSSCTRTNSGMVESVVQEGEAAVLLTTTTIALVASLGTNTMEGCTEIGKDGTCGSMYEPSMNTISGER